MASSDSLPPDDGPPPPDEAPPIAANEEAFRGPGESSFGGARRSKRVPPQDLEGERSVLGAMMLERSAVTACIETLKPEDFYRPAHGYIFEAILELFEKNEPVDEVTVHSALKLTGRLDAVGGIDYLNELCASTPTAANVDHYARMVRNAALTRKLINAATGIVSAGYEGASDVNVLLDQAESTVFEITSSRDQRSYTEMKDAVKDAFKQIEKLYERRDPITGVPTQYYDLDKMTSGLQPSDLIIVAGRPSMGKTAFALNMAQNAALKTGTPVLVFSLEMSTAQLVMRMLCSEARIDAHKLRAGALSKNDWPRLARAAGDLAEAPIFIDDTGSIPVLEMRAKARRLKAERDLGLIVVDYLQLMRGRANSEGREKEISEISRGLKALAKELNVPVVALSQLNRSLEQRQDKRPMLSDLRESGAIEQDADVIMFVYRDEYYNPESAEKGIAEIIIGKQRNGPVGTVQLRFVNSNVRFENLSREEPGA